MNRIKRPYIPLSVRLEVVKRQLREADKSAYKRQLISILCSDKPLTDQISKGLACLGLVNPQLDHDPALILRKFIPRTGLYSPRANDPNHLIYRAKADHQQKTTGRRPGAERTITTKGSDIGLKTKFARLERKAEFNENLAKLEKKWARSGAIRLARRKAKIASRPFSKEKRKFR